MRPQRSAHTSTSKRAREHTMRASSRRGDVSQTSPARHAATSRSEARELKNAAKERARERLHARQERLRAERSGERMGQISAHTQKNRQISSGRTSEKTLRHPTSPRTVSASEQNLPADVRRDAATDLESKENQASVVKNTSLMTIATLASRVTGLMRTWAMAFALGNTLLTSAYQVANNLPNVVYDFVAGGLLSAAFLPVLLLEQKRAGREGFNRYGSNILNLTMALLGVLTLLSIIFAEQVVATQTFTVGSSAEVSQTSVLFFRLFAVQIIFYGLGGVITGILNARRSFFLTSLAPALNNIVVIASFFSYVIIAPHAPHVALWVLGIGTSLGVAVQFIIQIPALKKADFHWRPVLDVRDPALVETFRIAVPTLIYITANLVAFSCRNAFSLPSGDVGPSTLAYAWIWYQLPYGVIAVSVSSALFTEMSDAVAHEAWDVLRRQVLRGIRATLYLIIPMAALIFVLSDKLMYIFNAGAFTSDAAQAVGLVLKLWIVSLPAYSVLMYLYKAFASIRKFFPFALLNCGLVLVQIALYAILSRPEIAGIYAIPLSDFVYYMLGAMASFALLMRYIGTMNLRSVGLLLAKVGICSVLGALVAAGIAGVLPFGQNILGAALTVMIAGGIGLILTLALTRVMRVEEAALIDTILRKLTRR